MNEVNPAEVLERLKSYNYCELEDLKVNISDLSVTAVAQLKGYAHMFIKPSDVGGKCAMCQNTHSFRWGITHGVMECTVCGNLAVMYHKVDVEGQINTIKFEQGLQYHGDCYTLEDSEE